MYFWTIGQSLRLPEIKIEKKIDLFNLMSFFPRIFQIAYCELVDIPI